MRRFFKSRYLADPIVYVQGDHVYRTVPPGGSVVEADGEIPPNWRNRLDEIGVEEAESLLAERRQRGPRQVERGLTRQVFVFDSPVALVTRACMEALFKMGWKARLNEGGALIAKEPFMWWHLFWAWPQRMTITAGELDGQTILRIDHFNYLGSVRPGYLYGKIERMIRLMDELLRGTARSEQPASPARTSP